MTEVAIFRGRAVTFTEPLSRPVGTSRDFGTKTHTHTQCTERRSIWVHGQTYIQSPISWTVRGEKWRGLSALHPSKCLMNHLSLSLLAQLLTHHLLFPSLHPCLSVSSLFSCRLTDATYWFRMRFECWRGRWGGGGRLICILFPFTAQIYHLFSIKLLIFYLFFPPMGQFEGRTVSCVLIGCVFPC